MATLIGVYNSDGCVGRCDARCHFAVCDDCHCICGGMNHGVGHDQAVENTRELARDQIQVIEKRGGYVAPEVLQASLL